MEPPESCSVLYEVLDSHAEMFEKAMLATAKREARKRATQAAERNPVMSKVIVRAVILFVSWLSHFGQSEFDLSL